MVSPYGNNYHTRDPRFRHISWREFGEERNEMCDHLQFEVIDPTLPILFDAIENVEIALALPAGLHDRASLANAHGALCEASRTLVAEDDDDGDGDGDE